MKYYYTDRDKIKYLHVLNLGKLLKVIKVHYV